MSILSTIGVAADHEANQVFQKLISEGVKTPDGANFPLPKPVMPDDASAKEQTKILTELMDGLPLDRFLRDSAVAPHIYRADEVQSDQQAIVRQIDVYFVAHAELASITQTEFTEQLSDGESKATGRVLTDEELRERDITLAVGAATDEVRESYAHGSFTILNRVELSVTGRSMATKTPSSLLAATHVDPRFSQDSEFPNRWKPLERTPDGSFSKGEPQAYQGAGTYLKITRLAAPTGAVFVEGHTIYTEPHGWFDGTNLLRAKLPAIAQTQIRAARRDMVKESRRSESR
jgi:hypothetical protein